MATIWLGNHEAVEYVDGQRLPLDGKRCTRVEPVDGMLYAEIIHDLIHPQGIWAAHSYALSPAWVASDDPRLAAAIAAVYGCPIRDPEPEA